eukprot:3181226-Rhodomonas_salina.1
MSGTGIAYAETLLRARYAMSGPEIAYAAARKEETWLLHVSVDRGVTWDQRTVVLAYAVSGTDQAYDLPTHVPGTDIACCPTRSFLQIRTVLSAHAHGMCRAALKLKQEQDDSGFYEMEVALPICLRARYALSGTGLAYGATSLRKCYAVSGTDIAHGATCLRACYALSGTDLAYGAPEHYQAALCKPRFQVQHGTAPYRPTHLLRNVRHCPKCPVLTWAVLLPGQQVLCSAAEHRPQGAEP